MPTLSRPWSVGAARFAKPTSVCRARLSPPSGASKKTNTEEATSQSSAGPFPKPTHTLPDTSTTAVNSSQAYEQDREPTPTVLASLTISYEKLSPSGDVISSPWAPSTAAGPATASGVAKTTTTNQTGIQRGSYEATAGEHTTSGSHKA